MSRVMVVRTYARIAGVSLLALGGACMLGVGTTSPVVDLAHLILGGIFSYVGFRERDQKVVHGVVRGLGLICLLGGVVLTFVAPALFGAFPNPGVGVGLLHLVLLLLGASSIAVAVVSERVSPTKR